MASNFFAFSIFLLSVAILSVFFVTVPMSLRLFNNWKKTQHTPTFSAFIFLAAVSLYFILIAFQVGFVLTEIWTSNYENKNFARILFLFSTFALVYFLFIPACLHYFREWKKSSKEKHFSLSLFFAVIVIFCFLFLCTSFMVYPT